MLTQAEADALTAMEKYLTDRSEWSSVDFPFPGMFLTVPLASADGRERFQLDMARGRIGRRWKLQLRNRQIYILVRLDLGGPGHLNPSQAPHRYLKPYEGIHVPTPHMQRYVEGFEDRWALPLPSEFTNPDDVATTWTQFLIYCNVVDAPNLQGSF